MPGEMKENASLRTSLRGRLHEHPGYLGLTEGDDIGNGNREGGPRNREENLLVVEDVQLLDVAVLPSRIARETILQDVGVHVV